MGEMRNVYDFFVVKPGGRRPHGRHGHRWEDNIRMVLRGTGWEGVA
jgi:hypothetical protein